MIGILYIKLDDCTIELDVSHNTIEGITINGDDEALKRCIGYSIDDVMDVYYRCNIYDEFVGDLMVTHQTKSNIHTLHKLGDGLYFGTNEDGFIINVNAKINDHTISIGEIDYSAFNGYLVPNRYHILKVIHPYIYESMNELTSGRYKMDYVRGILEVPYKLEPLEYLTLKHRLVIERNPICIVKDSVLTLISSSRWDYLKYLLNRTSQDPLIKDVKIIPNISEDVEDFIKLVQNTQFIDELEKNL